MSSTYKKFCFLALFFFSSMCLAITLPTQKIHPPYPDVWGYDLSEFPAVKWGEADIDAYRMKDGDLWFIVAYSYKVQDPRNPSDSEVDKKYRLIKFFEGTHIELSEQERWQLSDQMVKQSIPTIILPEKVHFTDGSTLKVHSLFVANRCPVPDFGILSFVKTDPQGKEQKYSIMGVSPQVQISSGRRDPDCDSIQVDSPFIYQKLYPFRQLIDLKDNTFIVLSSNSNLILRFDENLKTKFKPVAPVFLQHSDISRNFFVVDYALIDKLEDEVRKQKMPLYQGLHDALLLHFHKLYSE